MLEETSSGSRRRVLYRSDTETFPESSCLRTLEGQFQLHARSSECYDASPAKLVNQRHCLIMPLMIARQGLAKSTETTLSVAHSQVLATQMPCQSLLFACLPELSLEETTCLFIFAFWLLLLLLLLGLFWSKLVETSSGSINLPL